LHDDSGFEGKLPGAKSPTPNKDPGFRLPRIITDLCEARPVHLAIIDGITSMKGGEGAWCDDIQFVTPGLLIAGLNPVSTDAVGTALMGYADPRALRGTAPFPVSDNHLLLAEKRGIGVANLAEIEVLGRTIKESVYRYGV
jgi:hypothetical protein